MSSGLIKQLLEAVEVIVHREVAKAVSHEKWATVITASPLTVKQDGPADNPTIPATSLCGPLLAGARVFTQKMGRTIYVYGPPTPPELPTPPVDTGWITTGLDIVVATGWEMSSYRLRQMGSNIIGQVALTRSGETLTPNAAGNLTDNLMCTMPAGWRNGSGSNGQLLLACSGIKAAYGRANASDGTIQLTHGIPAVSIAQTEVWVITVDYTLD